MPPRKKAEPKTARPEHAKDLCEECGQHPIDSTASSFGCEHGTWVFGDDEAESESED